MILSSHIIKDSLTLSLNLISISRRVNSLFLFLPFSLLILGAQRSKVNEVSSLYLFHIT